MCLTYAIGPLVSWNLLCNVANVFWLKLMHLVCMHWILFCDMVIITINLCILSVVYCCRYKFPSVLLVYFLLSPIIFDITYLIRLFGREALFCRSSDLLETIDNPTPFCSFTGLYNITIMHWISGIICR